jgi:hypothetical protein
VQEVGIMSRVKKILFHRLQAKGMEQDLIPGFIRSLANTVHASPPKSLVQINQHLHYLGWDTFELDDHTLQLAVTCFEADGLKNLEYKPAQWFETRFNPQKAA